MKGLITKGSSGSGLVESGAASSAQFKGRRSKISAPPASQTRLEGIFGNLGTREPPTRPTLGPVRLQGLMWLILTPPAPSAGCRLKGLIPQMQKRIKPSKGLICTLTSTETIKVGLISAANSPQPIQRVGLKGFSHVWKEQRGGAREHSHTRTWMVGGEGGLAHALKGVQGLFQSVLGRFYLAQGFGWARAVLRPFGAVCDAVHQISTHPSKPAILVLAWRPFITRSPPPHTYQRTTQDPQPHKAKHERRRTRWRWRWRRRAPWPSPDRGYVRSRCAVGGGMIRCVCMYVPASSALVGRQDGRGSGVANAGVPFGRPYVRSSLVPDPTRAHILHPTTTTIRHDDHQGGQPALRLHQRRAPQRLRGVCNVSVLHKYISIDFERRM